MNGTHRDDLSQPSPLPAAPSTISSALAAAAARLAAAGRDTPRLDAEVLLRHVLGLDRAALLARLRDPLPDAATTVFAALIDRRLAGEPVAYLVGAREFMGLPFLVRPGVLIPRPETELLVEWALGWLAARPAAVVLDVGTGSGAIPLALAAHLPATWQGTLLASDVSAAALAVAVENRARLDSTHPAHLVRGDLAVWCRGPVDLLLANLPYLRPDQIAANPDLRAEPALALLGGPDGLDLIGRLLADAPRLLAPGAALALEIDPSQVAGTRDLILAAFPTASIAVRSDLAGLPRHVVALLPGDDVIHRRV